MMLVKDVMTKDVDTIEPGMDLKEAAVLMRDKDIGSVPVAEDGRLVAMLTDRDIVVASVANGNEAAATAARDAMSDSIYYCFADQPLEAAAEVMAEKRVRRLPVLTRDMQLIGIVSLGDISKHGGIGVAGEALEEISSAE
jgi:CBS domain-containing protein